MLISLSIQNYALISDLEISFTNGFSVLTGETGAGKSIILGALSLILGQRADSKSIRQGANKCLIEGIFDLSAYDLESYFTERELEYDARQCIVRREIWDSGKSRAFINDTPVSLNDLKELGIRLIDIHSQHQHLMLNDDLFQLHALDALAGNKSLKAEYGEAYRNYITIRRQLNRLKEEAAKNSADEEYLQFQCTQLQEARLKEGEQQLLEEEARTLLHIEEIKNGLFKIDRMLSDDEQGVVRSLKNGTDTALSLKQIFAPAKELSERLQSAYLDLKDLALETASLQEDLEFSPERLQTVNERLDQLYSLQQKHKVSSTEALITLLSEMENKLQSIHNLDSELETLQKQLDALYEQTLALAESISQSRQKAAATLEMELVAKAKTLGMPYVKFRCLLTPKSAPDESGMDDVEYLFSANKDMPLKPVSETASGGEISRLMLCIKVLIAGAMELPTIIFDEIDTGVSGEIADRMGGIMHALGRKIQVIAITHLPQIAAKGEKHYFVYKDEMGNATETHIRALSEEERVREIASMLSGSELSEAALANAKELLKSKY
ncbi:MAG: DNA repair protein RecN [Dysgonamonadaceae bacterium]|jgi:DNA repair protein RecN (Recombination protein N)|nr:DNA repair protein RecN [Dysgonamonadaceae bacterium]